MPDNHTYNEKELLHKIAEGDERAFGELFRMYVPKLEPFVRSITKSEALVDEVIQESFVRLWMNRERLAEIDSPKTWLYRVVSYVCFYYMRQRALQHRAIDKLAISDKNDDSAEQFMRLKDLEKILQQAISRLTPSQQKIYRLSREEGLKIPQIAMKLGISPNTVKNTMVASLKSIRKYASDQGFTLGVLLIWTVI